jgi:hypothetical protein
MAKHQVSIREYNATMDHYFPWKVDDEVVINKEGDRAVVEDATWEGENPNGGAYKMTYHVRKPDGKQIQLDLSEMLAFNPR